MQIVQDLAGYSLGGADILRRAMGKKLDGVMDVEKEKFIHGEVDKKGNILIPGCVRNGIDKKIAEEIWHQMEDFNKYAFNKSHSAGYAVIAIKTAWFKTYYPVEFMKSTLNAYIDNKDKVNSYLTTSRFMGIEFLPPNINKSKEDFTTLDGKIIFGLKGIRNISEMAERIVREREKKEFTNIQDFAERMASHEKIDKKAMDGLIYSGAVDNFKGTRSAKIEISPIILNRAKSVKEETQRGQINMLDLVEGGSELKEIKIPEIEEFNKRYMLEKEKEFTGYYVSGHPLDDYVEFFSEEETIETHKLRVESEYDEESGEYIKGESEFNSGDWVKVAGIINDVKILYTKKDQRLMASFEVEDKSGTIGCIIFPQQFEESSMRIQKGGIVLIEGKYQNDERGTQIIVSSVLDLEELSNLQKKQETKYIIVDVIDNRQLRMLKDFVDKNEGNVPVYINFKGQKLKSDKGISLNMSNFMKLKNIIDVESLKLVS